MPEALIELSETGEQFDIEDLFAEPGDDEGLVKERKNQAEIYIDVNDV